MKNKNLNASVERLMKTAGILRMLIVLWAVIVAGLVVYNVAIGIPENIRQAHQAGQAAPTFQVLVFRGEALAQSLGLLLVLLNGYFILSLLKNGEPLNPGIPSKIKNIGAVLIGTAVVLALLRAILTLISAASHSAFIFWMVGLPLKLLTVGVIFLLIARVFRLGVEMQQDEDLTV
jgi:hypothetical protein